VRPEGIFVRSPLIPVRVFGNVFFMKPCGRRAVLVVTRVVEGTSTSVARRRVELACQLETGHAGEHHDTQHGEKWADRASQIPTLLRHEEDDA
jgi:hypothetical protein